MTQISRSSRTLSRRGLLTGGAALATLAACGNPVGNFNAERLDSRVDATRDYLRQNHPELDTLFQDAQGILYMPLVTEAGLGPLGFMLIMNLLFIIAGMFLDIPMALALIVPLLAPVALANGADPVHLGIVICFNLTVGLVSPPMGGCLLIVSTVTGLNYWQLARAVIPFVIVEILVLGVLVMVPEISLVLPRAMGLWN